METRTMQPLKLEDLNAQFDSIVRRYCDGGLIAYRDTHYFMNDMLNLFERIERLRLFVNNDGAKKVLVHFTKKLGNLNIDDSNGEMSILLPEFKNLWMLFLNTASADVVTECRKWIENNILKTEMWLVEGELWGVYNEAFNSVADLKAKLKYFDKIIESEKQSDSIRSYRIGGWSRSRATVMRKLKMDNSEVKKYLADYATFTDSAFLLFDILVEESKFEEAENCLKHLLDTHKNWSGLAEKVHAKLKEMYRATGQTEKFGDMLKTMVVAQSRMDFYKEYKDFVPKQQWKVALVELLNSITKREFLMDVLAYENMTDELYASFCRVFSIGPSFFYFKRYGKALCPKYNAEFVKMFVEYLDGAMEHASNRKEYRNVVREAGELLKYEGGLPEVNRLKISWLSRFKNRPAMRDELEKI